jgi:CheY-like chemotaxis protein
MPVNSGYEVCEFVKSQPSMSHIPVVLLVGAMEPYDPEEGRRVKADGVITKPLQSSTLVGLVKELLASAKPAAAVPQRSSKVGEPAAGAKMQAAAAEPASAVAPPTVTSPDQPGPDAAMQRTADEPPAELAVQQEIAGIPREMAEQPLMATDELSAPEPAATGAVGQTSDLESDAAVPAAFAGASAADSEPQAEQQAAAFPFPGFPNSAETDEPQTGDTSAETATTLQRMVDQIGFTAGDADEESHPSALAFLSSLLGEQEDTPPPLVEEVENLSSAMAIEIAPDESSPRQGGRAVAWVVESVPLTAEDEKVFARSVSDWQALTDLLEAEPSAAADTAAAASAAELNAPAAAGIAEVLSAIETIVTPEVSAEVVKTTELPSMAVVTEETRQAGVAPVEVLETPASTPFEAAEAGLPVYEQSDASAEPAAPIQLTDETTAASGESSSESGPTEESLATLSIAGEEDIHLLHPVTEPLAANELNSELTAGSAAADEMWTPTASAQATGKIDPAHIEQLIRESLEQMMPQIVDRIVRTVGVILRRDQE